MPVGNTLLQMPRTLIMIKSKLKTARNTIIEHCHQSHTLLEKPKNTIEKFLPKMK